MLIENVKPRVFQEKKSTENSSIAKKSKSIVMNNLMSTKLKPKTTNAKKKILFSNALNILKQQNRIPLAIVYKSVDEVFEN